MDQIGQSDLRACLDAVQAIGAASASVECCARADAAILKCLMPHLADLCRVARAMDEARAAWGVPPAGAAPAPDAALTQREREVLRWLAGGKTDRDIGDILCISRRTVHKHLQRIYEKLGVECRTAAVVRAIGLAA